MTDRPELPPQSRISSRIDGNELTIVIPRAKVPTRGCATAAFAFLAITFLAQTLISGNPMWSLAGFVFVLLLATQIASLYKTPPKIELRITPDGITEITPIRRRQFPRSSLTTIRDEPPVSELSHLDPAELDWIAEQILAKWRARDAPAGQKPGP